MLAVAVATLVVPRAAMANWATVSAVRSSVQPYFACPPDGARLACQAIVDPPIKNPVRGPVAAGAVTAGPVEEVSPALEGSGIGGGYSPADLRSAYDLPSESAGAGQTVAIVDAYDDPTAEASLATYRSEYSLGECTTGNGCFRKVNQTGGTSYPQPSESWSKEITLDLDMVSAVCPKCHLLLVESESNSREDMSAAENEAAALGATEISNSFGGPGLSSPYASSYDHPGVPITAAGGDDGYGTEFPADTTYTIAVGGTALERSSNARGWDETVWQGTGSGCSEEPKPAWQTDSGCRYRTANDVAAVAAPNTPVSTYDNGWRDIGGTSVATPIVAGAMALANAYTRSLPGAEALYMEAEENGTGALDDVVSGSDGNCGDYLCEAGPGYDGPTGLGSLYGAPEVPSATATGPASKVTQASATLNATVNPDGEEVSECKFEYGTSESYGSSVPCTSLPGSGESPVEVSASVTGLTAHTTYHFRIVATGAGGTDYGADRAFTTLLAVVTGSASSVAHTSATLNGTVNPGGEEVSECKFEYGTTLSYGSSAPCSPSPGSGSGVVAVSASVTSLRPNTYYFRIVATGAGGTSYGSAQTFTTLRVAPAVVTRSASPVAHTSATLNGTVNPGGEEVSECKFEYGTTLSYGSSAPCSPSPGSGSGVVGVSASVTSLRPNTTYYFLVVATNAGGTSYGSYETFRTLPGPPSVVTEAASSITATSATLNGTLNANGLPLDGCYFSYEAVENGIGGRHLVPCSPWPVGWESPVAVSASLTELFEGLTYSFQLQVEEEPRENLEGAVQTFTVPPYPTGPAPTVTKLSVKKGPAAGGTSVTITGTHFTGASSVWFGSTRAARFTVTSGTSLTAETPASTAGETQVRVTTATGGTSDQVLPSRFTFEAPTITHLSPNTGSTAGGTTVTVTGGGFEVTGTRTANGTAIKFGENAGSSVHCVSTSTCTVVSPPATKGNAATVDVRARAGGKTSKNNPPADQFTYIA
jgi:hypothetical protein